MKKCAYAFLLGGVFSVIGQLFIFAWSAILGAGSTLVNPLTMVSMAALGLVLFVSGVAPKLEALTTMGVTIPISGMVVAIGGATFGTYMATRRASVAARTGAGLPLRVLGVGAGISVVLSAVLFFATHGALELSFEAVDFSPLASILLSFVVGGFLSLIAEIVYLVTKAPIPVLLAIFVVAGALLAMFNLDASPLLTNGGFIVSLLAAGQAAYETFEVLLAGITASAFITVVCVYLSVTVLGIAAGLLKTRMHSTDAEQEPRK